MSKFLQNRVAESPLLLPFASALTLMVWALAGGGVVSLACLAATAWLLVELNNGNALLRVRSHAVSSSFLVLQSLGGALLFDVRGSLAQLAFVGALFLLFTTYQDRQATGRTFYAFLCLGLGSLLWPGMLVYVPLVWLLMATRLLNISLRSWAASLLGLLTPYWFYGAWLLWQGALPDLTLVSSYTIDLSLWSAAGPMQTALLVFVAVVSLLGIIHFWSRSYEDRIRVRMLFGFFTSITLYTFVWIALWPAHFSMLLRLAFVGAAPLMAHFMAHTHTRPTRICFIAVAIAAAVIAVLNLWMPF